MKIQKGASGIFCVFLGKVSKWQNEKTQKTKSANALLIRRLLGTPVEDSQGTKKKTATSQFSESGGLLNGPDLFTELPFLWKSLPSPSFTELPPPLSLKNLFFTEKCFVASPSPKSALIWVVWRGGTGGHQATEITGLIGEMDKMRAEVANLGGTQMPGWYDAPSPKIKEEGRGTRNGHEASKGSKGISGL